MGKRKQWDDYKERQGKRRVGAKSDKASPKGCEGTLTVQRLSANVQGKCQKYNRIGPLTLVPFARMPVSRILEQIANVMPSRANAGPRTRMKVRSKTGRRSFTSDFWNMNSRKKPSNQSSSGHYIKVSQLAQESAIVRRQLLQNRP